MKQKNVLKYFCPPVAPVSIFNFGVPASRDTLLMIYTRKTKYKIQEGKKQNTKKKTKCKAEKVTFYKQQQKNGKKLEGSKSKGFEKCEGDLGRW